LDGAAIGIGTNVKHETPTAELPNAIP